MARIITKETKKEGQKKAKRWESIGTKKKEKVNSSHGRKVPHLSNVYCNLLIMGGLEQASPANVIFLFMVKAKTHWRAILTHCLKNWMQKNKDKRPIDCLLWKRQAHSLMKRFISCLSVLCTSMAIRIKWFPSWNPLYLRILTMHWVSQLHLLIE